MQNNTGQLDCSFSSQIRGEGLLIVVGATVILAQFSFFFQAPACPALFVMCTLPGNSHSAMGIHMNVVKSRRNFFMALTKTSV